MAAPLPMEKVRENIDELLPKKDREAALAILESDIPERHGSPAYERKMIRKGTPELAVNDDGRAQMARWIAYGVSYRAVEVITHLKPSSGNDVYRCVTHVLKKDKELKKVCKAIAKDRKRKRLQKIASAVFPSRLVNRRRPVLTSV